MKSFIFVFSFFAAFGLLNRTYADEFGYRCEFQSDRAVPADGNSHGSFGHPIFFSDSYNMELFFSSEPGNDKHVDVINESTPLGGDSSKYRPYLNSLSTVPCPNQLQATSKNLCFGGLEIDPTMVLVVPFDFFNSLPVATVTIEGPAMGFSVFDTYKCHMGE